MANNDNSPNDQERKRNVSELIKVIDKYIYLSEASGRGDTLEYWVYFFFQPYGFKVGQRAFTDAVASVLSVFSTNYKIVKKIEEISGEDDFAFACEILQKVVEFCNRISANEAIMARLEKAKWEVGNTSGLSMKNVLMEKKFFEYKLIHLRECILLGE
jgi:hypothetical protein